MNELSMHKTGLVVGTLLGGWHVLWAILVAAGVGQSLLDFVLWAHMIHTTWTVGPFDTVAAITLVALTSVAGYAIGCLIAWLWNQTHAVRP